MILSMGGVRGCWGACMVAGGMCGCRGGVWLPGGMHSCQGACMCHSTHSPLLTFLHPLRIAKATGLSYAGARLAVHGVGAVICILQTTVTRTIT